MSCKPDVYLKDIEIKKTRKPHRCGWCGHLITVGEVARNRVYVFDGEFQSEYDHPECYEALCDSNFDDNGFEFGAQERGKTIDESWA